MRNVTTSLGLLYWRKFDTEPRSTKTSPKQIDFSEDFTFLFHQSRGVKAFGPLPLPFNFKTNDSFVFPGMSRRAAFEGSEAQDASTRL